MTLTYQKAHERALSGQALECAIVGVSEIEWERAGLRAAQRGAAGEIEAIKTHIEIAKAWLGADQPDLARMAMEEARRRAVALQMRLTP